jgi:flagella basal body P-ring formation protein FlgA
MIKIFLFTFLLTNFAFAAQCIVDLYPKVYRLNKNRSFLEKDLIKYSDCSKNINAAIIKKIEETTKEINISKIETSFTELGTHITPRKIIIFELGEVLKEQLNKNNNFFFLDVKQIQNSTNAISLNENESLNFSCESCNSLGDKTLKIESINSVNNKSNVFWINTKIMAKIKVYKAKSNLGYQLKKLSKTDFIEDEIFSITPESVLGSLDNIEFFCPNKTIMEGSIITNIDIRPVNIIEYGSPVKAILKSDRLNLSKNGTAMRAAQFGDPIEINLGNNKTITGKAIDYNQAVIEL